MKLFTKKLTAMFLSLLMVLSSMGGMTPVYAAAEENASEETVVETATEETEEVLEEEEEVLEEEEEAPAEEAVAFSQSATVDGVKIEVTADAGVFPAGATLQVSSLDKKEETKVEKAIDEVAGEAAVAKQYIFDITVLDAAGNEIQPATDKGTVNVAFKTDEVADESLQTKVYHIADDGAAEALDVAAEGDVASVLTEGFSAYALVFEHFASSGSTGTYSLAYADGAVALTAILKAVGVDITGKVISNVECDSSAPISITGSGDNSVVRMSTSAPSGTDHALTVRFTDGTTAVVTIHVHKHNWSLTVDGNKATLKCNEANCPHSGTYTATLAASDATYDGMAHGAQLTQSYPSDCGISQVRYYSGSTQLSSTPVNAGTYRAEVTFSPDGGEAKTISATYTIKKADITFTTLAQPTYPTGVSSLTYSGYDQNLYTLAAAKSATTSKTFSVKYWYTSDSSHKFADHVLTGKDAATWSISYQAEGDTNHNDSEVKKLEIKIGPRPVYFTGITANNRIYNQKTNATLSYSGLQMHDVVTAVGDALTVTATGTFADKTAGTDKTVTISDAKLQAANENTVLSNYTLNTNDSRCQKTAKATIYRKEIQVDWTNAENFQYNGQPQAPEPVKRPGNASNDHDYLVYAGDEVTVGITEDSWKTEIGNNYEAKLTALGGKDAANYVLPDHDSTVRARFNIVEKVLEVEWANTEVEYNGFEQRPTATLKTPVEGEDVSVVISMNRSSINAGEYTASASLTGENASNYALNALTTTTPFTITKAPLEITASGWIYYGDRVSGNDSIHELNYEIDQSQFKGNDTQQSVLGGTPRFETDYGSKYNLVDPVSDETHTYYLFPHFETAANYEIDNEDGILTVYPKPVTLEWSDTHMGETKVVSDNAEYTYNGKKHSYSAVVTDDSYVTVNGRKIDDEIEVQEQMFVQRDANAKTETDKYTPYALSLSNKNYALVEIVEDGTRTEKDVATREINFKINQLPIELEWSPLEFTYNASFQAPSHTILNLQTDDEGVQDESFGISFETKKQTEVFDPERAPSIEAGFWMLTAINEENGLLEDANYTLQGSSTTKALYAIKQAPMNVYASGWITYGETVEDINKISDDTAGADFEYTHFEGEGEEVEEVDGFFLEDTEEDQIAKADSIVYESEDYEQFDDITSESKQYTVKVKEGLTSNNYDLTFVADELAVYPKTAEIEWHDEEKQALTSEDEPAYTYDGKEHGLTAIVKNTVNGDKVEGMTYEGNDMVDSNEKAGIDPYRATVTELDNANYTLLTNPKQVDKDGAEKELIAEDQRSHAFTVEPLPVVLTWKFDETVYNGKEQDNQPNVENLVEGDAYPLSCTDASKKDAGTYTAVVNEVTDKNYTIEGVENLSKEWTIKPLPVKLGWKYGKTTFNNMNQENVATVTNLVKGDVLTLAYEHPTEAKNVGKYETKVTALEGAAAANYTIEEAENLAQNWEIVQASIKKATVTVSNQKYTGKALTPAPKVVLNLAGKNVTLKAGTDYAVSYKNNKNVGTATLTVTGLGNYKDSVSKTFKIQLNGTFTVASSKNTGYVWDIAGNSKADKANLNLYKKNNSNAQKFKIEPVGNYYKITHVGTNKVIDLEGAKAQNGQNIQQYKWNGTKAQLWDIKQASDGTFTFYSAVNAKYVIDLVGAKAQDNQNIQLYTSNGTKAQKWKLNFA